MYLENKTQFSKYFMSQRINHFLNYKMFRNGCQEISCISYGMQLIQNLQKKNNYTRKEEKLNIENPSISFMKL